MRRGLNIAAVLLALVGVVWFFQGIGVIQGSFMTDQSGWAVIGLVAIVIASGLLFYNNRTHAHS